ncbi:LGFP repeat-containing protein [Nocardia sp. MW-W600-9]
MNHFARRTAAGGAAVIAAAGLLLAAGCGDEDKDNATDTVTSVMGSMPMSPGESMPMTPGGSMPMSPGESMPMTPGGGMTTSATAAGDSTTISTPNGDITVSGEVYKKYVAAGGASSPLGAPEEAQETGPNGGQYQDFTGGTIYWSSDTGAHIVWGDIRETWEEEGGANGPLGYPTSDETSTANGGKQSEFTGGTIVWVNGETTVTKK